MSHSLRHLETQETEYQVTYQALIRNLKRRKGFGLLFVRCTPAQGEEIIPQMQQDVRNKTIEVLRLEEAKENLFDIISEIQSRQKLDVLIITGIEKSFVEYIKPGIGGQGNYYKEDTVPRILGHLNLERERFRDELKVCLVFFVPRFALKYFVRRAPDFFDWRSGVFEFLTQKDCLERENSQFLAEGYTEHIKLTAQERIAKIFAIQELIEEEGQTPEQKADLCLEQGKVYAAAGEYEEAIVFYERATAINPDSYQAWSFQGLALEILGRLEEAIAAYQRAIEIKPDKDEAWTNLGAALANLGRFE
ncbi:MAG: tetratricopeptide repeat protein, partial [Oscillatoria sp. PMC 1050.18]|nr:tetratricopeptide repeat protein [Oscillatoria sp. PMC 1050.18]